MPSGALCEWYLLRVTSEGPTNRTTQTYGCSVVYECPGSPILCIQMAAVLLVVVLLDAVCCVVGDYKTSNNM